MTPDNIAVRLWAALYGITPEKALELNKGAMPEAWKQLEAEAEVIIAERIKAAGAKP
jgi:hypothetical protein